MGAAVGRKPLGKKPMTGAERVARYRAKHALKKPSPRAMAATIRKLQARIAELEAQLEEAQAAKRLAKAQRGAQ
jgi:hypothetical protein